MSRESGVDTPAIQVKVYSAFTTFIDGLCFSVSAVNHTGAFDILPGHRNFITVLSPCEIFVVTGGATQSLQIDHGVMHVREDKVTIYVDV